MSDHTWEDGVTDVGIIYVNVSSINVYKELNATPIQDYLDSI